MKNRKEGNKKRTRERQRKRERERQKKEKVKQGRLKRNKGRHRKNTQKMPFLGGKQGFFLAKAKTRKQQKTKKKQKRITKKGCIGPSEVALWATSPDP